MSRLTRNDLTAAKFAAIFDIVAPVHEYLKATDDAALTIDGNCVVTVGSAVFQTQRAVIGADSLDKGSGFITGRDYYVYICDSGAEDAVCMISLNATFPAGCNAANSRKIGGFHYGGCRRVDSALRPVNSRGVVYGAGWEGNVYTGIVPRSVWTLKHRPKSAPEGMVYAGAGLWVDIYLASDDGNGGVQSVFNGTPLTGTEGHNWYSFNDRALMVGKKLLSYAEFCKAAYGSPQGNDLDNDNAWSAAANRGRSPAGAVANAVSSVGCRDCAGNVWEWLSDFITRANGRVLNGAVSPALYTYPSYDGGRGGRVNRTGTGHGPAAYSDSSPDAAQGSYNWDTDSPLGDTAGGNPDNGNIYEYYDQSLFALLGGGRWRFGAHTGARAVRMGICPWFVGTRRGARYASESL